MAIILIMRGHTGWRQFVDYDEQRDRPNLNRALLWRVWQYARPYQGRTLFLLLLIFLSTGLELLPPLLLRDLLDNAVPNGNLTRLNWLALSMISVPLVNALIGVAQRYFSATIGEHLIADLRQTLFDQMHRFGLRFFTHAKTGELMSRLNNDVVGAQRALTGTFITIVTNIVTIVSTLLIMVSLEWRLTLLSVVIFPLFIAPTRRIGRLLRDVRRQSMILNGKMNNVMNETLNVSGALLVKLFGRQSAESERFRQHSEEVAQIGVRSAMIGQWFWLGLGLVTAIGTAIVFWAGGYLVIKNLFTIGTLVAFTSYLRQLYGPLSAMTNAHIEFATSMVSFERVFEILDLPIEIQDRPNAHTLRDVQGRLQFENVSFSYADRGDGGAEALGLTADRHDPLAQTIPHRTQGRTMAIENLSFQVQAGELTALVGPSGAGKSTITYLLPRLYDPTIGRILLDGHDLRDITQTSLAENIGMVTQETYLFHDTIRANLLYAKPDATQAEIEAACQAANIHPFIASLPQGYETVVGERGYRLSGGEKQRISLARVILKNPRLLVLDEATSSLDSQSEALIQQALERILQGRTSVVIAHRLSTVLSADLILVIDQGRLIESARKSAEQTAHQQLLAQNGLYASLFHTQFATHPA